MNTYRDPENACVKLEITTATSNYPIYIGPNLLSQVDFYLSRVLPTGLGICSLSAMRRSTLSTAGWWRKTSRNQARESTGL